MEYDTHTQCKYSAEQIAEWNKRQLEIDFNNETRRTDT